MKKASAAVESLSMFNAYEVLNLTPSFTLDLETLEKAYLEEIRHIHPDHHCTQGEEQRKKSLEETAKMNEAYRILKDPLLRAHHFLTLSGVSISFEQALSPEVLEESLALREVLEDASSLEEVQSLMDETQGKMESLLSHLSGLFETKDFKESQKVIEHLSYFKRFIQEAQEKLWSLEDAGERGL